MREFRILFLSFGIFLTLVLTAEAQQGKVYTGMFGLYGWPNYTEKLNQVKSNNFDMAVIGLADWMIDGAQSQGLKSIGDYKFTVEMTKDPDKWNYYVSRVTELVTHFRSNPSIYAWYLVDEPDGQDIPIEKIKFIRQLVKKLDPTRPLFTVLCKPDKWYKYMPYFDIIAVDPYLFKKPATDETIVTQWLRKAKDDMRRLKINKPLWVVLGAFDLKFTAPPYNSSFNKPTPEQFNRMVDLSLAEKVDGILVFTLGVINYPVYFDWDLVKQDPNLWDAVRKVPQRVQTNAR